MMRLTKLIRMLIDNINVTNKKYNYGKVKRNKKQRKIINA